MRFSSSCCILSKFYIKPQLYSCRREAIAVVSYRNSTSNHNTPLYSYWVQQLYLIEILHQTTTALAANGVSSSCILSKFYIKPQQRVRHKLGHSVVSYRNSTSNHNIGNEFLFNPNVVSYRNSTSNHNPGGNTLSAGFVVSYRNSTSNHNAKAQWTFDIVLYLIEILHQTTTTRWPTV